jgi:microcystin degradation protein MlrC
VDVVGQASEKRIGLLNHLLQFRTRLTSLQEAVALALATADREKPALVFADVADNPGGGARGKTMFILEAFARGGPACAMRWWA